VFFPQQKEYPKSIKRGIREMRPSIILSSFEYYTYASEVFERISLSEDISHTKSYEDVNVNVDVGKWILVMEK